MSTIYDIVRSNTLDIPNFDMLLGKWFSISVKPDFSSNEILNIGVAFQHGENIYTKFIENYSKINSIFNEAAEDELRFLTKVAESALRRGDTSEPSLSIAYSKPKFARGSNIDEILESVFNSTVKLGVKHKPTKKGPKFLNNTYARKLTFEHIQIKAGILAENLISDQLAFSFSKNLKNVYLDIPLNSKGLIGTIVSAGFSNPQSVETALLKAYLDLMTASSIQSEKKKYKGFFVLRPREFEAYLEKSKLNQIDNIIDLFDWKLKKQNIKPTIEDDPEKLANEIISASNIK